MAKTIHTESKHFFAILSGQWKKIIYAVECLLHPTLTNLHITQYDIIVGSTFSDIGG